MGRAQPAVQGGGTKEGQRLTNPHARALQQLREHSDSDASYQSRAQSHQRDARNTLAITRLQQALNAVSSPNQDSADIIWAHMSTKSFRDTRRNIIYSIAETLNTNRTLLACFFCSTSWQSRHLECFIPTLASQVAETIPLAQPHILSSILERTPDDDVFEGSVRHQSEALLERPLLTAIGANAPEWSQEKALFIIVDGLGDRLVENDDEAQTEIIEALDQLTTTIRVNTNRRLKVLISTEATTTRLKNQFASLGIRVAAVSIAVDGSADSEPFEKRPQVRGDRIDVDESLESFYDERLRVIQRRYDLGTDWPSQKEVDWFKENASGKGWRDFAETAMQFLYEGHPKSRLEEVQSAVIGLGSNLDALDALYAMILHDFDPQTPLSAPLIIQLANHPNPVWRGQTYITMEYILRLPPGYMYKFSRSSRLSALVDLDDVRLKPHKASFTKFLSDARRSGKHALFVEPAMVRRVILRTQAFKHVLEPTAPLGTWNTDASTLNDIFLEDDMLGGFCAHDMAEAFRDRFWPVLSPQTRNEFQWQATRCLVQNQTTTKTLVQQGPLEESKRVRAVQNFVRRLNVETLDIWAITFLRQYHTTYVPLDSPGFESGFTSAPRRHQPFRAEFRRRTQAYALGSFGEEFALCFVYLSALQINGDSNQLKPPLKGASPERAFVKHTIRKNQRLRRLDEAAWNLQDVDSWVRVAEIWPTYANCLWFDANVATLAAPGKAELITMALSAVVRDEWLANLLEAVDQPHDSEGMSFALSGVSNRPDALRMVLRELRLELLTSFLSQYAVTLPVHVLVNQCRFALTNTGLEGEWDFLSLLMQYFNLYTFQYLNDEEMAIYTRSKSRHDDLVALKMHEDLEDLYRGLALLFNTDAPASTKLDFSIPVVPSDSEHLTAMDRLTHDNDLGSPPTPAPQAEVFPSPEDIEADSDMYTDSDRAPTPPPSVNRRSLQSQLFQRVYHETIHDLERQYVKNSSAWAAPLTSAPSALSVMALLSKAANSKAASSLKLDDLVVVANSEPTGTLPSNYLHSNLQHCADLGRVAFLSIQNKMCFIHTISQRIASRGGPIVRITEYLRDPEDPTYDFASEVDSVMVSGASCLKAAKEASERLAYWHRIIQHLETCLLAERGVYVRERADTNRETKLNKTTWRETRRDCEDAIIAMRWGLNSPDSNPSGSYVSEILDDAYTELSLRYDRLGEVKASLQELEDQKRRIQTEAIDLMDIESILRTSSDQVVELDAQIESLVGLFAAISDGIQADLSGNVDTFLQSLNDGSIEQDAIKSENFAQSATWRITKAAFEARGHFLAIAAISEAYENVAQSFILPALNQLETLAGCSDAEWGEQSENFLLDCRKWTYKIDEIVLRVTKDVQANMKGNMDLV